MIKILVIEDEEDLLELIEFHLKEAGYDAVGFLNTKKAKDFIIEENPDLLIIDRNLKGMEGINFVKKLKKEGFNFSVIFLTAKSDEKEILEGFEAGADDYITKPFSFEILKARIKAVLNRKNTNEIISFKNYKLNLNSMEIETNNEIIPLTKNETKLLKLFFENPKKVITKEEIAEIFDISLKSVNVAINRLNHKINIIKSIRGVGYKLIEN